MKTLWLKKDKDDEHGTIPDGVKLSESEAVLLIKLAGSLSLNDLRKRDFEDSDARIIMDWYHAI